MIHAKNYETVKVMQKKPWPLFFRTRCIYFASVQYVAMLHTNIGIGMGVGIARGQCYWILVQCHWRCMVRDADSVSISLATQCNAQR